MKKGSANILSGCVTGWCMSDILRLFAYQYTSVDLLPFTRYDDVQLLYMQVADTR